MSEWEFFSNFFRSRQDHIYIYFFKGKSNSGFLFLPSFLRFHACGVVVEDLCRCQIHTKIVIMLRAQKSLENDFHAHNDAIEIPFRFEGTNERKNERDFSHFLNLIMPPFSDPPPYFFIRPKQTSTGARRSFADFGSQARRRRAARKRLWVKRVREWKRERERYAFFNM